MCAFCLQQAFNIANRGLSKIVAFSVIGFFIMNMATMPLWNIEGLIFFAILISVVFALATTKRSIHANKRDRNLNHEVRKVI